MIIISCVSCISNAAEIYNNNGNKLELNGKLNALHYFSDNKSIDGDQTFFRLTAKGETEINEYLTGYGLWESQIKGQFAENSDTHNFWTRFAYAGLRFGNASIDYGRNYGVMYDLVGAWLDILPEFSNDSYNITDNYATGRTNNVLTYRNSSLFNIDSWRLTVQYLGKNGGNGETNNYRSIKNQNGNGWGIATSYNIHPHFSIGTSYINAERTDEQKTVMPGDKAEAWNIGIKYYNGNAYFASQYAETRNMTPFGNFSNQSKSGDYISAGFANKNKVFEAIAAYYFDNGITPYLSYRLSKGENLSINNKQYGEEKLSEYINIAVSYDFNKNMKTYIDYKINLLNDNEFTRQSDIALDDIIAISLMYKF
ncbi:TPA: hypothetical protein JW655_005248 [Escherichia coli]|nr:hypothetical protein [Escherichia coli]